MAVTLSTTARDVGVNAIVDRIDAGGGAGKLEIQDSGSVVLSTHTLAATSFGASSSGIATLLGVPITDSSADASGTAALFRIRDFADVTLISGTVSTVAAGTGDLQLDSTTIVAGGVVNINSLTFTIPAS